MNAHREFELLMPWYANGSLEEDDMSRMQQHLETCGQCRTVLTEEIRQAQGLHRSDDSARLHRLLAEQDGSFDRLRSRLELLEDTQAPRSPSRLAPTLATLMVICLPLALLGSLQPTVFETRSTETTIDGPVLQLVFEADTAAEDIDLLLSTSGTLIGAPSPGGVYRIALQTSDPAALLERIRRHPAVRWAEVEL